MSWYVSPRFKFHELQDGTVDAITVLQDQIQGWVFEFAECLASKRHGGLAALMVCTALIERLESFDLGKSSRGKSEEFFVARFPRIFTSVSKGGAQTAYDALRCGLYHECCLRGGIVIAPDGNASVSEENNCVRICPSLFVADLKAYFENWIANADESLKKNIKTLMLTQSRAAPLVNEVPTLGTASSFWKDR